MAGKTIGYIYLDEEDITEIHADQLKAHGGQPGLRNPGGLASAAAQPQSSFGGKDLYPDVYSKAAALMRNFAALALPKVCTPPQEDSDYDAVIAIANQ